MKNCANGKWGCRVIAFVCVGMLAFGRASEALEETGAKAKESVETTATDKEEYPHLPLYAKGAVLIDGDSGRILYAKEADVVMPMASTTKIMTCILALEYGGEEEWVSFSSYAASQPKVHLGAKAGRQFRLKDLLYSLMLESHNDTAVAIAEHIGVKSLLSEGEQKEEDIDSKQAVDEFARLMNEKAKELGCENTFFVTPNGLDGNKEVEVNGEKVLKKHGTTAYELAKIMQYCVYQSPQKEDFLQITRQTNYSFWDKEGVVCYSCNNHNNLLHQMPQALSGKTGFTNAAGYCYVAALQEGEEKYCLALLACGWPNNKNYKWADSKELFAYGKETYDYKVFELSPTLSEVLVKNGTDNTGNPYIDRKVVPVAEKAGELKRKYTMLVKEGEEVLCRVNQQLFLDAPVEAGTLIGEVEYYIKTETGEDRTLEKVPLFVAEKIEEIDFVYILRYIVDNFIVQGKK